MNCITSANASKSTCRPDTTIPERKQVSCGEPSSPSPSPSSTTATSAKKPRTKSTQHYTLQPTEKHDRTYTYVQTEHAYPESERKRQSERDLEDSFSSRRCVGLGFVPVRNAKITARKRRRVAGSISGITCILYR